MFYELAEDAKPSAPDTKEAEALAASLNRSAERVQTLWFSFLIFMVYLAIATWTTTHRMLFLGEPLNLPVLNIKLPLLGFYILTPVIFVTFHFYMLLNLVLLARTAKSFEDALGRAFPEDGEPRENFRMRIENTLFVQLLVGGRLEREGTNAKLLSLMALITLALAPVALLLMIQIKFLPYHSEWITWLHRGLLTLDLALVWTLWPGYRRQAGVRLWPKKSWLPLPAATLSAATLAYVTLAATFPDEGIYIATSWLHLTIEVPSRFHTVLQEHRSDSTYSLLDDHRKLVVNKSDSIAGINYENRLSRFWYTLLAPINTLDLHGEDLTDDAKLTDITNKNESSTNAQRWVATLSLKGRDLTGANLEGADIRHMDFGDAILNRANLDRAWAMKAHFDGNAQLRGASLDNALLQGASLNDAQLQGAALVGTQQGSTLLGAWIQYSTLVNAQLQGASLDYAQLQGTSLNSAHLQGASLNYAQLQDSTLYAAHLQGASLEYAQLQDATLNDANLQTTRGSRVPCYSELTSRPRHLFMYVFGELTLEERLGRIQGSHSQSRMIIMSAS
ncbi:MAG TPA: pentapeptide repeat-containing protein [Methylocella sp.]|jgi:uncharacterized protein YjbI with pentapeptide repeats